MVTGAATVVEAIKAGRQVAISIDRYFKGEDLTAGRQVNLQPVDIPPGDFAKAPRVKMARLAPAEAQEDFC